LKRTFVPKPVRSHLLLLSIIMVALLCVAAPAKSADLRSVTVDLEDGRYMLTSEAWLSVPPDALYRVLIDYDLFVKFSSYFIESRNLPPTVEGHPGFFTLTEACVLWFCKSFKRTGHLTFEAPFDIDAFVDPEVSDFEYSHETWRLAEKDGGTLMTYTFDMDPRFWVPPIVGPFLMKRALLKSGEDAITRIEAVAQGREPER
jgi:hypothetical protein